MIKTSYQTDNPSITVDDESYLKTKAPRWIWFALVGIVSPAGFRRCGSPAGEWFS